MYLAARQRWGGWNRVLGSGGAPQPAESTADRRPDSGGAPQPAESRRLVRVPLGTSADRAFALHVVRRGVCIRRSFGEAGSEITCVHVRVPQ